jgi:hypothetical protein
VLTWEMSWLCFPWAPTDRACLFPEPLSYYIPCDKNSCYDESDLLFLFLKFSGAFLACPASLLGQMPTVWSPGSLSLWTQQGFTANCSLEAALEPG